MYDIGFYFEWFLASVGLMFLTFLYMDAWHYFECGKSVLFGDKGSHECP